MGRPAKGPLPDRIPRERIIRKLRARGLTLRAIGRVFDLSPERVRQILGRSERRQRFRRYQVREQARRLQEKELWEKEWL